jgi:phenylalanyl-tRNA synthetase beta chain
MVSEEMLDGSANEAVKLANPLGEEFVYMRRSIAPSLKKIVAENKRFESIRIFEIANVYQKKKKDLPLQYPHFAGAVKDKQYTFFHIKGMVEQLFSDLQVHQVQFSPNESSDLQTNISIKSEILGSVELVEQGYYTFELNLSKLLAFVGKQQQYRPLSKYPPVIEDLSFILPLDVPTGDVIEAIQKTDRLIDSATLLDRYQEARTFHILYQSQERNLTSEDVAKIREKIITVVKEKFGAKLKS